MIGFVATFAVIQVFQLGPDRRGDYDLRSLGH
jgi:hypothetical protein